MQNILNEFTKKNLSKVQQMLAAKKVVKQAENSLAQANEYLARTELQLVEAIHENGESINSLSRWMTWII